jgi:hypothetical protein
MAKREVSAIESGMGVGVSILTTLLKKAKEKGLPEGAIHQLAKPKGEALIGKFVEMLAEASGSTNPTLSLKVNYDLRVEAAIKAGKYDWTNDNITDKNFPTSRTGQHEVEMKLFHFNRDMTSEQVIEELKKQGYRPAELHELLVLGEKYPDLQRQFPIIALGSVWQDWDDRFVPCLCRRGDERFLIPGYFNSRWDGRCRFAAVRK